MESFKEINIKNRAFYFFNDMINIKDFNTNQIKKDKNSYKKYWHLLHWIYHNKRYWLCKYS